MSDFTLHPITPARKSEIPPLAAIASTALVALITSLISMVWVA